MKTRGDGIWLSKKAANSYMDKVAKESSFTGQHKGYTILPHKIHRLGVGRRIQMALTLSEQRR